jgi:hypothetical protein
MRGENVKKQKQELRIELYVSKPVIVVGGRESNSKVTKHYSSFTLESEFTKPVLCNLPRGAGPPDADKVWPAVALTLAAAIAQGLCMGYPAGSRLRS